MALTETKQIDLAGGPVNLAADTDIADGIANATDGYRIFLQNASTRAKAYYRETTAEPDTTDRSHPLCPNDGFVLTLYDDTPGAWIWAASTGMISVTEAK